MPPLRVRPRAPRSGLACLTPSGTDRVGRAVLRFLEVDARPVAVNDEEVRALLRHFGSTERFMSASREELEAVPGVPPKVAREVYDRLHKTRAGEGVTRVPEEAEARWS